MVEVTLLKGRAMNITECESLAKAADDSWYVKEQFEELGLQEDAAYLVAANPETILALIALVREMGEALEDTKQKFHGKSLEWLNWRYQKVLTKYKEMTNGFERHDRSYASG